MLKPRLIVIIVFLIVSCNPGQNRKYYLFPENYQGVAMVVFEQNDGKEVRSENGVEIYDMGPDGIIKVKQKGTIGLANESYYHVRPDGSRSEIPYYDAVDIKIKNPDKSMVLCYNSERGETMDSVTGREIRFQVMLISSIQNLDSIAKIRSSFVNSVLRK